MLTTMISQFIETFNAKPTISYKTGNNEYTTILLADCGKVQLTIKTDFTFHFEPNNIINEILTGDITPKEVSYNYL